MATLKVLISCPVTSQLICSYVFTYAKSRFSHDVVYIVLYRKFFNDLSDICSMFAVQWALTDNVNILAEVVVSAL